MINQNNIEFLSKFGSKEHIDKIIRHESFGYHEAWDMHENPNFKLENHRVDLKYRLRPDHFDKIVALTSSDPKELDQIVGSRKTEMVNALLKNPHLTLAHRSSIADHTERFYHDISI